MPRWALPVVLVVAVAVVIGSVLVGRVLSATSGREQTLAQQVLNACAAGGPAGAELNAAGACPLARRVQAEPVPGPIGAPGTDGRDGAPGRDGIDGQDGPPGPDGAPGADGQDGAPGTDGAPGQDGPPGMNGMNGMDGQDGAPGADGKPPAGFTFVDGDGVQQTCTRDPGSPDDAATYTCTTASRNDPPAMGLTLLS